MRPLAIQNTMPSFSCWRPLASNQKLRYEKITILLWLLLWIWKIYLDLFPNVSKIGFFFNHFSQIEFNYKKKYELYNIKYDLYHLSSPIIPPPLPAFQNWTCLSHFFHIVFLCMCLCDTLTSQHEHKKCFSSVMSRSLAKAWTITSLAI